MVQESADDAHHHRAEERCDKPTHMKAEGLHDLSNDPEKNGVDDEREEPERKTRDRQSQKLDDWPDNRIDHSQNSDRYQRCHHALCSVGDPEAQMEHLAQKDRYVERDRAQYPA